MKKIFLMLSAAFFVLNVSAQNKATTKKPLTKKAIVSKHSPAKPIQLITMKSKLDSASYAFGMAMAANLKSGGLEKLNYNLLNQGMKDAFAGANTLMTEQVSQQAINNIFESHAKVREEKEKIKYQDNIKAGETFLAQNKSNPNIKTTPSGLQYEVLTEGNGLQPKATDKVTVHYKGSLLNGTEFDSSYKRNEPASFGLNQVIPGWTEGVQLMKEGAKYRFFIPYQLAYGARGAGQDIKPFSTLIFEVELLKIEKPN